MCIYTFPHTLCRSGPCLYESGLIPKKLGFMEDAEVLKYGIGMSNIVPRTTRTANELSRKEIKEWSKVMIQRMQELKPLIICFNGKGIYEIYTGGKCTVGIQEEPLPGTDIVVYVMPSTSGRAATYPRRSDKLKFFSELRDLRDRLRRERGERGGINENKGTSGGVESSAQTTSDSGQHSVSKPTSDGNSSEPASTASEDLSGVAVDGSSAHCDSAPSTSAATEQTAAAGEGRRLQRLPVIVGTGRYSHTPCDPSSSGRESKVDPQPLDQLAATHTPTSQSDNSAGLSATERQTDIVRSPYFSS
jgi:TDG/mug DNA glycosylase family protein